MVVTKAELRLLVCSQQKRVPMGNAKEKKWVKTTDCSKKVIDMIHHQD
jgi:hypothetical protein